DASPAAPASATFPADKTTFHIYLLMGQSNMAGRDNRNLPPPLHNPHVLALSQGEWIMAQEPLHPVEKNKVAGVGPGIPFALEMLKADPKVTIGLVPCAVGGTPLKRWVKGADLYEKALSRAKIAAQAGVIKGVLWHQGESDTSAQQDAETYEARLAKMFKDLRADLGQPDLPIVVGQLGDFLNESPEKYPYFETVRAAIKHIPEVVPHTGYADSAGLGHKGDKLHFSAEAQKEMGKRFAKAMQELEK
ncbi:MAG TPA: sialate O-acetylesterase, partial [Bryobacteraceae bacterium]|nr:sialate O-acetylesterase [Bryobacteraceae bacterium]